jgi:hypothetical protein
MAYAGIMGCSSEGKKVPCVAMGVFGLENEVIHYMLILHFFLFGLWNGIGWCISPHSSQANN